MITRDAETLASLGDAGRRPTKFAGGHARQRDNLAPAKWFARRGEFFGHGSWLAASEIAAPIASGVIPPARATAAASAAREGVPSKMTLLGHPSAIVDPTGRRWQGGSPNTLTPTRIA